VAPIEPYPELFATGPLRTWVRDLDSQALFFTYSGAKLSKRQKILSDVRDCARFPMRDPAVIGTVDAKSFLLQIYSKFVRFAAPDNAKAMGRGQRGVLAFSRLTAIVGIRLIDKVCRAGSQINARFFRSARTLKVTELDGHISSPRLATMTNHLRIQRDVLAYALGREDFDGVLFVTASVYMRWSRTRKWLESTLESADFGAVPIRGSQELQYGRGSQELQYGGTVAFFSREGARRLVAARKINFGILQDLALGRWISSHAWALTEIPMSTYSSLHQALPEDGTFPEGIVGVICSNHPDRSKESGWMRKLQRLV